MFSEIYINSIPFVVAIISLLGVYYVFTKPIYAFYLIIFTLPLKNFYIFFGTNFEIWKILSLAFIVIKLPQWFLIKSNNFFKNKYFKLLLIFIFYVVLISIIQYVFLGFSNTNTLTGGWIKNDGRLITQISFFILTFNLILLPSFVIKTFKQLYSTIKVIFYSTLILAFFGFFQFLFFTFTGINLFPINGSDGVYHTGYILDTVFRINSIAGEPKHLAIAMVIGISILLFYRVKKIKLTNNDLPILLLLIFNLIFTFSTTGYVLMFLSFFSIVFINGFLKRNAFIFLFMACVFFLINLNFSISGKNTILKQTNRANFEVQDLSIVNYFQEDPSQLIFGKGLGNIHNYSAKYIPDDFPLFKDAPYKANSGLLYMLSDYGIVGLIILVIITVKLFKKDLRNNKILGIAELDIISHITLLLALLFLFRYYELVFVFIGISISKIGLIKKFILLQK